MKEDPADGRDVAARAGLSLTLVRPYGRRVDAMVTLTDKPIDTESLLSGACQPSAGAVVLFLGITRELTGGRRTVTLDYEAYREMAQEQLNELEAEARRRWPLVECAIVQLLWACIPLDRHR